MFRLHNNRKLKVNDIEMKLSKSIFKAAHFLFSTEPSQFIQHTLANAALDFEIRSSKKLKSCGSRAQTRKNSRK